MFILPTVGCNERGMVILIAINMAFQGFIAGGEFPMLIDYSGNYAGTIYGIASVAESIARFIAPFIRGELVKNDVSSLYFHENIPNIFESKIYVFLNFFLLEFS